MDPAIRCCSLVKVYPGRPPVEAVRGIDLEVTPGECFGVLGPNGAGKTTTIEILEGLLAPTSGRVEIFGMDWATNAMAIRERIGISLQETRLEENLAVLETITLFRSFYHTGIEPQEAMARVSLEEKARAWVKHLSGGQRQRLAVATALVGNPDLLFLDEPTTGLDPQSRRQLWDIIEQFKREGRTVLLTTHYMEEAERLCDRVAVVDHGKVIALGSPRQLIRELVGSNVVEFWYTARPDQTGPSANDWSSLPAVSSVHIDSELVRITTPQPHVLIPAVRAVRRGAPVPQARRE